MMIGLGEGDLGSGGKGPRGSPVAVVVPSVVC